MQKSLFVKSRKLNIYIGIRTMRVPESSYPLERISMNTVLGGDSPNKSGNDDKVNG